MAESFIERNSWAPGVIVAVVLFVIGTAITLYLRYRDQERKTLDYQVLSNVAVLTSTGARPERLKILFDDTEARDPSITQIRIENTGKQVIEPDDFLTCVQIRRDNCEILEWGIVEESADGVSGDIGMTLFPGECERIDSTPGTMNPGDWFTLQIVFDGDKDEPLCVTGRMRGEKRPMQAISPQRRAKRFFLTAGISAGPAGVASGYFAAKLTANEATERFPSSPIWLLMLGAGIVTGIALSRAWFLIRRQTTSPR